MNKIIVLAIFICMICIQSCRICTDVDCSSIDEAQIIVSGFQNHEIDTLVFSTFEKDNSFINPIQNDTLIYNSYYSPWEDTLKSDPISIHINIDYDYKLEIVSLSQDYYIKKIKTYQSKCNEGFRCNDYVELIESFKLNGVKIPSDGGVGLDIIKSE